jgi:hypothetical protein
MNLCLKNCYCDRIQQILLGLTAASIGSKSSKFQRQNLPVFRVLISLACWWGRSPSVKLWLTLNYLTRLRAREGFVRLGYEWFLTLCSYHNFHRKVFLYHSIVTLNFSEIFSLNMTPKHIMILQIQAVCGQ